MGENEGFRVVGRGPTKMSSINKREVLIKESPINK